jgi:hypothetical protein
MPGTDAPQPQPVAEAWIVENAPMTDGTQLVMVQIVGPTGNKVSFLDPLTALKVSEHLKACSVQARSGLIVPKNGLKA